jgi:hypothetical protein
MPGLGPGIHVLPPCHSKDVDGRDKPGHDKSKDVDGRDIGGRKHAVLWTAIPCHDEWESPIAPLVLRAVLLVQCLSARHARACRGHPRLAALQQTKTWMAGTSPAMTNSEYVWIKSTVPIEFCSISANYF